MTRPVFADGTEVSVRWDGEWTAATVVRSAQDYSEDYACLYLVRADGVLVGWFGDALVWPVGHPHTLA